MALINTALNLNSWTISEVSHFLFRSRPEPTSPRQHSHLKPQGIDRDHQRGARHRRSGDQQRDEAGDALYNIDMITPALTTPSF
jgi:hypothetical protein